MPFRRKPAGGIGEGRALDADARSRRGDDAWRQDKKRRSVPSERDRWCADPVNEKLTEQVSLAVVVIVMTARDAVRAREVVAVPPQSVGRVPWKAPQSAGTARPRPLKIFAIAQSRLNFMPLGTQRAVRRWGISRPQTANA